MNNENLPILSWPDESGWWWCEYNDDAGFRIVEIVSVDSHLWVWQHYQDDPMTEYGWSQTVRGPARFTKVLEEVPFTGDNI